MRRRRPAIKGCDIVIAMPGKLEQLTLWTGVDETLGNMAIGQVRDSLMAFLKNERGIHVESLMVALGALAGHASLHAAFAVAAADPGKASLMTVETRDGATFYAGDTLNAFLIPENPEIVSLWGLIAASALALGVPQAELPGYVDIFRRAAGTLGTPAFGLLDVPENHRPGATPRQFLDALWPAIQRLLRWSNPSLDNGRTLPTRYWPYVFGMVARQYIEMTKDVLDPRLSLRLIMEAAIPMSKVDPRTVPQELKT